MNYLIYAILIIIIFLCGVLIGSFYCYVSDFKVIINKKNPTSNEHLNVFPYTLVFWWNKDEDQIFVRNNKVSTKSFIVWDNYVSHREFFRKVDIAVISKKQSDKKVEEQILLYNDLWNKYVKLRDKSRIQEHETRDKTPSE